ncbi:MAG: hypothetical protein ACLSVD_12485 [Eggerthellaceae bacterium]
MFWLWWGFHVLAGVRRGRPVHQPHREHSGLRSDHAAGNDLYTRYADVLQNDTVQT